MRKGALLKAVEEAVRTHENYTKVGKRVTVLRPFIWNVVGHKLKQVLQVSVMHREG